jgi:murein DD-endopeptidase MepM/ murein hydrolase activator NlpD
VHKTMGGDVVWAGSSNPCENLVVFEDNDYQVWLAHLSAITISKDYILQYRKVFGFSGNASNSKGAHLHFGIKQKTGEIIYVWLNLQLICADDEYINIGYSS